MTGLNSPQEPSNGFGSGQGWNQNPQQWNQPGQPPQPLPGYGDNGYIAPPPPQPPKKKHPVLKTVAIIIAALVALTVVVNLGGSDEPAADPAPQVTQAAPAPKDEPKTKVEKKADPAPKPKAKKTTQAPPPAPSTPEYTTAQQMAIDSAESYLELTGFSKKGLIGQLSSEYGEGFEKADARFAVNHIDVDWNEQAVRVAESYLDLTPMSEAGLVDQLHSPYGDQFTLAQAQYGAHQAYANR